MNKGYLLQALTIDLQKTWADWLYMLFEECVEVDGVLVIPAKLVDKWRKQLHMRPIDWPDEDKAKVEAIAERLINIYNQQAILRSASSNSSVIEAILGTRCSALMKAARSWLKRMNGLTLG